MEWRGISLRSGMRTRLGCIGTGTGEWKFGNPPRESGRGSTLGVVVDGCIAK